MRVCDAIGEAKHFTAARCEQKIVFAHRIINDGYHRIAKVGVKHITGCQKNLLIVVNGASGRKIFILIAVFNIFMNTTISANGAVTVKTPLSGAGDYIELQARMDLIIGMTACSAGKCNNFECTTIDVEVW